MDRRSEPRLLTQTPVRVEALRGAAIQMDGTIVNTSGRGLCVHVPQALNMGELVRLRTQGHHTFAMVRFCHPEDGHFTAGLERAGEWRQLPEGGMLPDLAAMPAPRLAPQNQDLGGARTAALQDLFAGTGKQPAQPRRSKTTVVVGAAGGIVALGALLGMWRLGGSAEVPAPAVAPSVHAAAATEADPGRRIAIEATADTFVLACADGRTVVQRLFQAGERTEFPYAESALLRASDGSAMVVTRSAEPLGPMADAAGARAWQFVGDRRQEIAAASIRDCAAPVASP